MPESNHTGITSNMGCVGDGQSSFTLFTILDIKVAKLQERNINLKMTNKINNSLYF